MKTPYLISLADVTADKHGLDRRLVHALISQESSWNPWAWNPEPRYRYFWDVRAGAPFRAVTDAEINSEKPPADFPSLSGDPDHEWWAQQASWGLMQIMGAVARERGSRLPFLTELCDAPVNLEYGCLHLASNFEWARRRATNKNDVMMSALAAYNGGRAGNEPGKPLRNFDYAKKVVARMEDGVL